MKKDALILVRGGGDLATGTIHRLWSAGLRVLVLEAEHPAAIRRQVSLCEAVYEGETAVEGLRGGADQTPAEGRRFQKKHRPSCSDRPAEKQRRQSRMSLWMRSLPKKNLGTTRDMAPP